MPEEDWMARRQCDAFIEHLFDVLEEQGWGAIVWNDDGEQRGYFMEVIQEAWQRARMKAVR